MKARCLLCSLPVLGTQEVGEQAVLPEEVSSGKARARGSPDLMLDTSLGAGLQPAEQGGWGAGSRPAQPSAPVPPGAQPRASLRLHSRPGWHELQGPDFLEPAQQGALARASGRSELGAFSPTVPQDRRPAFQKMPAHTHCADLLVSKGKDQIQAPAQPQINSPLSGRAWRGQNRDPGWDPGQDRSAAGLCHPW